MTVLVDPACETTVHKLPGKQATKKSFLLHETSMNEGRVPSHLEKDWGDEKGQNSHNS